MAAAMSGSLIYRVLSLRCAWCGANACGGAAEPACDGARLGARIGQMRREHASVAGLARQLGTSWRTVWTSIMPLLESPPSTRLSTGSRDPQNSGRKPRALHLRGIALWFRNPINYIARSLLEAG